MCGVVGFLGGDFSSVERNSQILKRMSDAIVSRGPDSGGVWLDQDRKIALAHRRLAIVDLSPAGHQPMSSSSDRYTISYNGEIYNSEEIRAELQGRFGAITWRGHSDTEVLLAGFDAWGIKETISRTTGMFAIAIWDKKLEQLTLVRDRMGEKPLYYGWQGSGNNKTFLFGSELKALKMHPKFSHEIDRSSLALYMRYSYVPAPHSIYEQIKKVEPGSIVTVSLNNEIKHERYWDSSEVAQAGSQSPLTTSYAEVTERLDLMLRKTISQQMVSDVPLGAFLSGGVDSSTVVAIMQSLATHPVKTFTIGFSEAGYNEAEFAKLVARHVGTDHTELYVSSQDALDVIPKLPRLYCEPFADSSQIPTFLVSSLARDHVTVSLSGDGGDELFCGYNRYLFTHKLWNGLRLTPGIIRKLIASGVTKVPAGIWDKIFRQLDKATPAKFNGVRWGDKLQKGARVMGSEDLTALYQSLVSNWQDPSSAVIGALEHRQMFSSDAKALSTLGEIQKMMAIDMVSYLPDDILVKVDRAAMGVSLETRVPFLDRHIVEFASQIPLAMKTHNGVGKSVLRSVLYKYVPKELIERPKMGFGMPVGEWLRGPLRDWAEDLLDEPKLVSQGYFHPEIIRRMWSEHISGARNWQSQLWVVLMFQAWLEDQKL